MKKKKKTVKKIKLGEATKHIGAKTYSESLSQNNPLMITITDIENERSFEIKGNAVFIKSDDVNTQIPTHLLLKAVRNYLDNSPIASVGTHDKKDW